MLLRVLKLGTECRDLATKLEGTLTHWTLDMGKGVMYLFQPKGLDEDGQPVKKLFLCLERLEGVENEFEEVDVPFEILGTQVTNKPSGFTGMATEFVRHVNGCFHVVIQPAGRLSKKNVPIAARDFDLRECTGKMIPQLKESELRESKAKRPSPTGDSFLREPARGDEHHTR
jgi:hypothetical protein